MNKMQRKVEYSLMALQLMSQKPSNELSSAKELAESVLAPFDVMARVLQLMAQKGIVKSEHGALGGYRIVQDLSQVSVHDLVTLLQGPVQIAKCLKKDDGCDIQSHCNIVLPIHNLNTRLNEFYQSLSVQEILFSGRSSNRVNHV